jgi:anti-sigma factor RsiW
VPEIDRKILRQLSQATMFSDCPCIKTLGDLMDGKLNPDDKESVESHLRSCPACLNRLIELRELAHSDRARLPGFLAALLPRYWTEKMEPPPRVVKAVISMVQPKAPPLSSALDPK